MNLLAALLRWRGRGDAFARSVIDEPELIDAQDDRAVIFRRLNRAVRRAATVHQELLNLDLVRIQADHLRERQLDRAEAIAARLEKATAVAQEALQRLEAVSREAGPAGE